MTDTTDDSLPPPSSSAGRQRWNSAMKLLRRVHMFSGLLMLPWVLLYGVTAMLFNHPTAFPDATVSRLDGPERPLPFPAAEELAAQLVAAELSSAQLSSASGEGLVLEPGSARYVGIVFLDGKSGDAQYRIRFDPADGSAVAQTTSQPNRPLEQAGPGTAPFARKPGTAGDPKLLPELERELGRRLVADGLAEPTPGTPGQAAVKARAAPRLLFRVRTADGRVWNAVHELQRGSLTATPADQPSADDLSTRRFLLRLHLAHEYPADPTNVRFAWALCVDAMFVCMVFWGLSGVLMWWQIKPARWWGAAVLLLSAALAGWLSWAMHARLAAP